MAASDLTLSEEQVSRLAVLSDGLDPMSLAAQFLSTRLELTTRDTCLDTAGKGTSVLFKNTIYAKKADLNSSSAGAINNH